VFGLIEEIGTRRGGLAAAAMRVVTFAVAFAVNQIRVFGAHAGARPGTIDQSGFDARDIAGDPNRTAAAGASLRAE
jgi:hypothetical protein